MGTPRKLSLPRQNKGADALKSVGRNLRYMVGHLNGYAAWRDSLGVTQLEGGFYAQVPALAATAGLTSYPQGESWMYISGDSSWPLSTGYVRTLTINAGTGGHRARQTFHSKADGRSWVRWSSDGSAWEAWHWAGSVAAQYGHTASAIPGTSVWTALPISSSSGTADVHSSTASGLVTIAYGGVAVVSHYGLWSTSDSFHGIVRILHNGSEIGYLDKFVDSSANRRYSLSGTWPVATGDTIGIEVWQNKGADRDYAGNTRITLAPRSPW